MEDKPLLIEVVTYAPTTFYHCTHCEVVWKETGFSQGVHEEQIASALPPDVMQDYRAVSDWVNQLCQEYSDRVVVKVIDAASIEGFWKTLRHGLRHYPAIVVGLARFNGTDFSAAGAEIAHRLGVVAA
ncbi:hypothetical protein TFLX_01016 [Thermoflexales bacterium]|nr:hypothetical protein TFLX_01016 [Thermoflexales bacterium]